MQFEILSQEDEERRIKEFKSIYYELNAKPDSVTKIYNNKVVIYKDDIERLDNLIREKLSFHVSKEEVGISNVTVATSKHKVYSFNDFKMFAIHNWAVPEHINSITLVWDFLVHVEEYKRPQRHKLTVKISGGLKPEEMLGLLFSGKIEDIQEIEEQQATIIAQMDFIENRLGQEFINIVGEWVDTLQRAYVDKNKFILWLKKHRKMVAYYFNYMLFLLMSILARIGFNYTIEILEIEKVIQLEIGQLRFLINYAVIAILICMFTINRGEVIANKIFRYLTEYGESFVFRITKGDEKAYNEIAANDKESTLKIMFNIIFSLILNVACSIIASILYSKI